MLIISSFRPFDQDPTGEYVRNQLAAKASWESMADAIVYFNEPEPRLASAKTRFISSDPFPRIMDITEVCAMQPGWTAIVNSDIVLGPKFPIVEQRLKLKQATCAASWRWEFDPARGIESAAKERIPHDNGIDFFAATQPVWKKVYEAVDERLRIGCTFWDTWLMSFFTTFEVSHFWDISPARVIFHPRHDGRKYGPGPEDHNQIKIYSWPVFPDAKIYA